MSWQELLINIINLIKVKKKIKIHLMQYWNSKVINNNIDQILCEIQKKEGVIN